MAATFTNRLVTVNASLYYGTDSSAATGIYGATGGQVQYVLFTPNAAAVTSRFGANTPYRLIINWPGSGATFPATAVNSQMLATSTAGQKLGYSGSPDANWPTMIAFPQASNGWTGSGVNRDNRSIHLIVQAIIDDLCANFSIDRSRIYAISESGGTSSSMENVLGRIRWPDHFGIDWAGIICVASQLSGSGSGFRGDLPEIEQSENSTNQTVPRICQWFGLHNATKVQTAMWWINSTGDFDNTTSFNQIAQYANSGGSDYGVDTGGTSQFNTMKKVGQWFRWTQYSGVGAPGHVASWDFAYGNGFTGGAMVVTDPLFAWLMAQQWTPPQRIRVPAHGTSVYTYTPAPDPVTSPRLFVRDRQGSRRGRFV
jgi:hypothetical protein